MGNANNERSNFSKMALVAVGGLVHRELDKVTIIAVSGCIDGIMFCESQIRMVSMGCGGREKSTSTVEYVSFDRWASTNE